MTAAANPPAGGTAGDARPPVAYLVRGDEPSEILGATRRLLHELVGERDAAMVVEEHGGGADTVDIGAVLDALTTPPMLVDRRVVVVRQAGRLTAADGAALAAWLAAPVDGVHLVVAAGGGTVPAALVKAVQQHGQVVDTTVGSGATRSRWLADQLRQAPVRLDEAARSRLLDHVGEDVDVVRAVVAALADAFGAGATVHADDLDAFLGTAGAVAPWHLTDAIDRGDGAAAIDVLHRLLGPGSMHPLAVLTVLHRHYQTMLRLDGAGVASAEQAAELLGVRSAYPVRKAMEQGRRLGSERIARAIELLADADLDVRGATGLPPDTVVEVLVGRLSRLVPKRAPRRSAVR